MTDTDVDVQPAPESLAERLTRGPLTFREALRISTGVAAQLRNLHANGLEYGALSAQTVVIGPGGAGLVPRNGVARKAGSHGDVAVFGELMELMLDGALTAHHLLGLWGEAAALAHRCLKQAPEIQQVLIALRLLGMRTRVALAAPVQSAPAAGLGARLKSIALQATAAVARQPRDPVVKST